MHAHIHTHSPTLHSLHGDSTELCDAISRASTLAESVSSKVRLLDQAKVIVFLPLACQTGKLNVNICVCVSFCFMTSDLNNVLIPVLLTDVIQLLLKVTTHSVFASTLIWPEAL